VAISRLPLKSDGASLRCVLVDALRAQKGRATRSDIGGVLMAKQKNPGVAAVLSLILPGAGQFYNGAFLRGIVWLLVLGVSWIGTGGTLVWICHFIAAYTAYNYAERYNRGEIG